MGITPINLDITERLRDHAFAVEYVAALEEQDAELRVAMRRAADILERNLSHQRETVEDAAAILRRALKL